MLYQYLYSLSEHWAPFNVFRYITFRTFIAFLSTFLFCWWLGPKYINRLVRKQLGQQVRDDGPASHKKKSGTPTMGGGLILASMAPAALFWVDLKNPLVWGVLIISFVFAFVGYLDDHLKVSKKNTKGLSGKLRLVVEFGITGLVVGTLVWRGDISPILTFPFLKEVGIDLGWFYVPFAMFVIVGCANAVNLTDGLDGLAIVPVMVAVGTMILFSYIAGHWTIANYLQIPFVPGSGELAPLGASLVAAGLGFLWYNTYPAQVFMGDVGSLSIGGFLGTLAVVTKNEVLLAIVGGIFVAEALSVIIQVASFKLTGKRVLRMAPLHHHFELKGVSEPKLIVRFWIVALLLAVLSLSTLKLR